METIGCRYDSLEWTSHGIIRMSSKGFSVVLEVDLSYFANYTKRAKAYWPRRNMYVRDLIYDTFKPDRLATLVLSITRQAGIKRTADGQDMASCSSKPTLQRY